MVTNGDYQVTGLRLRRDVESWLSGKCGIYLFPFNGGSTKAVPAIAVLPDNEHGYSYPPEDVQVSGLEVVIVRLVVSPRKLLGKDLHKRYPWEIYLKLWDNNGNLIEATEALINGLHSCGYCFQSPQAISPDEGSIGQIKVLVLDSLVQVWD